jgi:hypothetical protein
MGIETATPVFERAKTVHALDRAAAVIGSDRVVIAAQVKQLSCCS